MNSVNWIDITMVFVFGGGLIGLMLRNMFNIQKEMRSFVTRKELKEIMDEKCGCILKEINHLKDSIKK